MGCPLAELETNKLTMLRDLSPWKIEVAGKAMVTSIYMTTISMTICTRSRTLSTLAVAAGLVEVTECSTMSLPHKWLTLPLTTSPAI